MDRKISSSRSLLAMVNKIAEAMAKVRFLDVPVRPKLDKLTNMLAINSALLSSSSKLELQSDHHLASDSIRGQRFGTIV